MNSSIIQPPSHQVHSYLKMQLDSQTLAAIPMHQVQEVIVTSRTKITPIPNMPNSVLGLINQRSRIYWVIDLAHLLGIAPLNSDVKEFYLILLRVSDLILGLAVQTAKEVTKFTPDQIESPSSSLSPELVPYLRGCVPDQKDFLLVLEGVAIVNSPQIQGF